MAHSENKYNWYVVYTRPRWEKKVASLLEEKGIGYYCPLNKVSKTWSDRKKIVLEPLFKGYIFIYTNENQKWGVKKINGILNYVHWLGKPAIVKEEEINTIKKFLQEFDGVQVVSPELKTDSHVIIKQGILMNYEGMVIEVKGSQARVLVKSLGLVLTATFDKKNLMPI